MFVPRQRMAALGVLAFTSAAATGCVDIAAGHASYTETVEKRFAVSGAPTLHISTFDGTVDVSAWDRPEILVTVEKIGADKAATDRMELSVSQEGDRVTVDVREPHRGGVNWTVGPFTAHVRVSMPAHARVEASTGDGRVAVRDIIGDLLVRTGDGAIRLEHVNGGVDATSGDGSIDIDGVLTTLKLRSGDGRLRVRTTGSSATGDWEVSTGDGSVVVEVPEGFAANLDALTGDGRVRVDGLEFSGQLDRDDRTRARGTLGAGGGRISIRSGDGGITVRRAEPL